MNIEEYISSGILELYATGALPAAEMAEVELLARQYPEIQSELEEVIYTLDQYAQLHAVSPPGHLRNKVLTAVAQHNTSIGINEVNELSPYTAFKENEIIPINPRESTPEAPLFNWLVAAALALLLVSSALNIYYYTNWKDSEQNLQLALNSQQQYAQNLQQVQQRLTDNQQALALLTDNATVRVALNGLPKSPDAKVTIYWNRPTGNVYLDVEKLPPPPAGKQYQLWAIADGKPADAGLLNGQDIATELQQMKEVSVAQAFAITLEPQGGSVNPTLDTMIVMGQI